MLSVENRQRMHGGVPPLIVQKAQLRRAYQHINVIAHIVLQL